MRQKIARQSLGEGYCDRCSTQRALRIECVELSSEFSILLSLYVEVPDGESLLALIERDWALFSSDVLDKNSLLEALLPGTTGQRFISAHPLIGSPADRWLELKDELKYKNRFFPSSAPDRDELSQLLGLLVISQEDVPREFYRARIQTNEKSLNLEDMKAPPLGIAQAGRANPPGLSYLYAASEPETAICEVRPTVGDVVSIGKFRAVKPFKLVDLSDPRAQISPFGLDLAALSNVQASMGLLAMLSEDLTKPTPPHKAAYEYLATQYLCELIKTLGYDGVRYRSSLNPGGHNFAFFNVEILRPLEMNPMVEVKGVHLEFE
ncbi:RES family NAD+ phosphorylase [uncultured Xanthomonas sp.]|uniref:RES family NAD+ phosphorylase n=1 Tax=uncultured Xanthomonas sp. TaxID=152831 RepID=UPI0025F8C588|nr:RES family NAD+ phosphorylase [uncultured Xanthomonas sp.]